MLRNLAGRALLRWGAYDRRDGGSRIGGLQPRGEESLTVGEVVRLTQQDVPEPHVDFGGHQEPH